MCVHGTKVTHVCSSDLSVFDTHDGTCITTARCRKASKSQNDTSYWTHLRLIQIEEVGVQYTVLRSSFNYFSQKATLILACATYRPPYSEIFGLPDSPDDIARKCARYSLFELHLGDQHNVQPTWLEPLGDWQVDGFAKASDIVRNEVDGTSFLLSVTASLPSSSQVRCPLFTSTASTM